MIFRNIYVYAYTCMHTKTIREKIGHEFEGKHGGEKAREKCCDYIIHSFKNEMKRRKLPVFA